MVQYHQGLTSKSHLTFECKKKKKKHNIKTGTKAVCASMGEMEL